MYNSSADGADPLQGRRIGCTRQVLDDSSRGEPLILVENLTKLFGTLVAVEDFSFAVQPGEILGLVGPNGAGKTTTLRMLAGILPPTHGKIEIGGHSMEKEPVEAKRRLAFIPDEQKFFDYLTVSEHLRFMARIYRVDHFEEKQRRLIEELELAGKENALSRELSRGMRQKLAIACALIHEPSVLMLDEPLTGLDPMGIRTMKDMILERGRAGVAVIVSSHLLTLVEELCTDVLIIQKGRKILDGKLKDIAHRIPDLKKDARLEEIFFAVTRTGPGTGTPAGNHETPKGDKDR
jgi:ABC-2 type transport system ATP-binding protein